MLENDPLTIIWFSPSSSGLTEIQQEFSSYAWTSSPESLLDNYKNLTLPPVILFDLKGFLNQSLDLIKTLSKTIPSIPILVIAESDRVNPSLLLNTLKNGAFDFYIGPLNGELIKYRLKILKKFITSKTTKSELAKASFNDHDASEEIELAFMAFYDELTGLPNRKLFFSRLEDQLKLDCSDGRCVPLLYIDLDGFKEINDSYTHKVGDWLLQQVSMRLRQCVKRSDTVARMGGDEFSIILTNTLHETTEIANIAQRILYTLQAPYFYNGQQIKISASIGIAFYPQNAGSPHELVNRADQAMYQAKNAGSGKYAFYNSKLITEHAKFFIKN
jgi:diguanylate cyclase (GGDEF)-like protein